MAEPSLSEPQSIGSAASSSSLSANLLYAVLTYRGDLATWNWAFFVPDPSVLPIGSSGTLFHVITTPAPDSPSDPSSSTSTSTSTASSTTTFPPDSPGEWTLSVEPGKDIVSSPLVVAIVRLADVGFLGGYDDVVGQDSLLPMFRTVGVPQRGTSAREFSSRTWFLDAICALHDCGVLQCDDVWLLEREIRRSAFTAMDKYLQNKGVWNVDWRCGLGAEWGLC
ncbi:hypothetical protein BDZ94DRAFT_1277042 [Collybia nuda]|uniref:Uncharacterized protein n=1 Tax=Collybia nuda TaxID=64659 RepID=A0A9P5XUD5_9AGAR|nr:hypothetical protein BDZ94DRAFT_1277042 [Collybia nuda]